MGVRIANGSLQRMSRPPSQPDGRPESGTVVTPGGPRPPSSVHRVGPGDEVRRSAGGQRVVKRSARTRGEGSMAEAHVVTPGGYRHPSLVHRVEAGTVVDRTAGRLRLVH